MSIQEESIGLLASNEPQLRVYLPSQWRQKKVSTTFVHNVGLDEAL